MLRGYARNCRRWIAFEHISFEESIALNLQLGQLETIALGGDDNQTMYELRLSAAKDATETLHYSAIRIIHCSEHMREEMGQKLKAVLSRTDSSDSSELPDAPATPNWMSMNDLSTALAEMRVFDVQLGETTIAPRLDRLRGRVAGLPTSEKHALALVGEAQLNTAGEVTYPRQALTNRLDAQGRLAFVLEQCLHTRCEGARLIEDARLEPRAEEMGWIELRGVPRGGRVTAAPVDSADSQTLIPDGHQISLPPGEYNLQREDCCGCTISRITTVDQGRVSVADMSLDRCGSIFVIPAGIRDAGSYAARVALYDASGNNTELNLTTQGALFAGLREPEYELRVIDGDGTAVWTTRVSVSDHIVKRIEIPQAIAATLPFFHPSVEVLIRDDGIRD